MIHVNLQDTIRRPVREVFDRIVDIDRYPEWRTGGGGIFVTCSQLSPGPVQRGTEYIDRTRLGAARGEVAEFRPPVEVVFHYVFRVLGRPAIEGWPGYTLEEVAPDVTRVHHRAEARVYGPAKLLEPLLQKLAERERRLTLQALKSSFR